MALGILEDFRQSSNAYDFGECNTMLVLHDVNGDGQAEAFLSHAEYRVGGVHIWRVYTPTESGVARYVGNIDVHPRGLRVVAGQSGFFTYAGEAYEQWSIAEKGMYSIGQSALDATNSNAVPFWAQRCSAVGETFWAGADDATLTDVNLEAEVVNGAAELAAAASAGDIDAMRRLLNDWVDMYAAENAGGTALLAAASSGQLESLRYLLTQSDAHTDTVFTGMIRGAAWYGHMDVLTEILRQDLGDSRAAIVQDALGSASHAGNTAAIPVLLASGGDANAPTSQWETRTPLELASEFDNDGVIEAFRAAGIGVGRAGEVALFNAIDNGDEAAVRELVAAGVSADSMQSGDYPTTALMWSIYRRQHAITLALLELGADVNKADSRSDIPLVLAAQYGHLDAVLAMLDRGAPLSSTDRLKTDVVSGAAGSGEYEIVSILLGRDTSDLPDDALHRALGNAAQGGHSNVVCLLLASGADLTWTNELERNAATVATFAGRQGMVELLGSWESECETVSPEQVN